MEEIYHNKETLKNMDDADFKIFVNLVCGFKFSQYLLQERMEYDNTDSFVKQLLWSIVTDSLLNPLGQILFTYKQLMEAPKKERWKYITNKQWLQYVDFIKIEYKDRTNEEIYKDTKEAVDKIFLNDWEKICKFDNNLFASEV